MYDRLKRKNPASTSKQEQASVFPHQSIFDGMSNFLCEGRILTFKGSLTLSSTVQYGSALLFLLTLAVIIRSVYSKLRSDLTKLAVFLGLRDNPVLNAHTMKSVGSKSPIIDNGQQECAELYEDFTTGKFEDAFTRVLTTLQAANTNQIFLRREDVASLIAKLAEMGACSSSPSLKRRLTFMDFDVQSVSRNNLSAFSLASRNSVRRSSYQSFLSDDIDSIYTELDEDHLDIPITSVLSNSTTSSKSPNNNCEDLDIGIFRDNGEFPPVRRGFVDALVSLNKPSFLTKTYTKLQRSTSTPMHSKDESNSGKKQIGLI
jgi:hypothetical protein